MRLTWPNALLALLAVGAGCHSTPAQPASADVLPDRLCAALLDAAPADWLDALGPLHARGSAAAAPLVRAIEVRPTAPGAPAAVALLGRIGDADAAVFLAGLVQDRDPLAVEAALALGELGLPRAAAGADTLVACAVDRFADATLRTAAACAAVRLGLRTAVAELLHAVLLAGTPAGRDLQARVGLPEKPRWAYERYLVQRLLRDLQPDDPGFDTDAPWSDLERAATRIRAWLDG